MGDMRTIVPRRKDRIIHVETELGIVNVYLRLHDEQGRRVEHIEIIPSGYAGEPCVTLEGGASRLIEQTPIDEGILRTVMSDKDADRILGKG